jgi:hypothetical protein
LRWWVAANQRQVLKAPRVQKGRRGHKAPKDLLDQRVRPALRELLDLLDLLDRRARPALLALLDLPDRRAKLAFRQRSTL